jgi:hypothetical protein
MSRVIQRPSDEPDERIPDSSAIGTLAIAKPVKPDQVVDRSRPDHYLHHDGTSPLSLPRLRRCRWASGVHEMDTTRHLDDAVRPD